MEERGLTSLQLAVISQQDISADRPLFINATTLKPTENGTILISKYTVDTLPASGLVCIGGLSKGTFYNICLSNSGNEVCRQEATEATDVGGDTMEECLSPTSIVMEMQRTGTATGEMKWVWLGWGLREFTPLFRCFS